MVSDSKSDVRKYRGFKSLPLRNFFKIALSGGVTEWPKVHDWKSCVLKGTEGSNPFPSASARLRAFNPVYGPG
jgi:hypothetical protein